MDLQDYRDRFPSIRMCREDGVLEIMLHRNGQSARWDFGADGIHRQLGDAFHAVGQDPENRVVILTGAGEVFLTEVDPADPATTEAMGATFWDRIYREGRALLHNLLHIEAPIIAAVNGDAFLHAELAVMSDIVLCAEGAQFADKAHFVNGVVPGDGAQIIWPMLLGPNRGRYFLLTGEEISAAEALRLGVVSEVLAREALLPRAWELAREIAAKPPLVTRYTRLALVEPLKRRLHSELSHSLLLEGLAFLG